MTVHDDLDGLLTRWLDETAGAGAPDYLDETLTGIASLRQRPAWLSPGMWLPMQLATSRVALPRVVPLLMLLSLLVVAAVIALAIAGSQSRPPAPFGLAATGRFVYDSEGDLFVANADGTGVRRLLDATSGAFGATWSRDGRHIAYWATTTADAAALWIVDADGSNAHRIGDDVSPPPDPAFPAVDWSPSGDALAFAAGGRSFIVDANGRGLRELAGRSLAARDDPAWSPDGHLIAFHGTLPSGEPAVYVVRADGTGEQRVSVARGTDLTHKFPSWSPDGTALTYQTGVVGRNVAIARRTATGWDESIVAGIALEASWPRFSNAGDHLSYLVSDASNTGWLVVADSDGTHPHRLESPLIAWAPHCWTPDDRSIVAVTGEPNVEIGREANPGFVVVSVDGTEPPALIPTPHRSAFAACSWQRLPFAG
jgi:Tol biopolymer transport system component